MKLLPITFATVVLSLCAATTFAQNPPCKGYRKGDPNCSPTPPGSVVAQVGPKQFSYDLSVTRVGQGDVIEFTPVNVSWTLSVKVVGFAGPDPKPVDVDVCPAIMPPPPDNPSTVCAHVSQASAGQTRRGNLTVPAPPAGLQAPLRLVVLIPAQGDEDYGQRVVVGEGSAALDVAARYDVALTGFEVLTTRSTFTDTVWSSLQGQIKATPSHFSDNPEACKTVGFQTWCVFNQAYGNAGDGSHPITNVHVFPYDLVPERETDLRFVFDLDNHDHNPAAEIGAAVANGFSKAGMIILSAYGAQSGNSGAGGVATQLDNAMEALHSSMTASCDGQVAADVVILTNKTIANQSQFTLDALTRGSGVFASTAPEVYRNIDGDLRCDRRGGAYKVLYQITRTSWQRWGFQPAY